MRKNSLGVNINHVTVRKSVQRPACRHGFMMLDILVSISVLTLIIVPLIVFMANKQDIQSYFHREEKSYFDAYFTKDLIFSNNLYKTKKNCDVFMSKVLKSATESNGINLGISLSNVILKKQTYNILNHDRNLPTSIEVIDNGMGHIFPDANSIATATILIGANSASTTDSDIYMFVDRLASTTGFQMDTNSLTMDATSTAQRFTKVMERDIGPGVIDITLSGEYLYALQRSAVVPISKIKFAYGLSDTANLLSMNLSLGGEFDTFTYFSPDLIRKTFPKTIETYEDVLFIGSEKSIEPELYGIRDTNISSNSLNYPLYRQNSHQSSVAGTDTESPYMLFSAEINAGVNDIEIYDDLLVVTSPKDPEVELFSLGEITGPASVDGSVDSSVNGLDQYHGLGSSSGNVAQNIKHTDIDLEGSSGNGKSLRASFMDLFIGRTVGNYELMRAKYLLIKYSSKQLGRGSISTSTSSAIPDDMDFMISAIANPNKSVIAIQPVLGGAYMLIFSNNPEYSTVIYARDKKGEYVQSIVLATQNPLVDYDCSTGALYLLEQSTTTSLTTFSVN